MKILHGADLHLDSAFVGRSPDAVAALRRAQLPFFLETPTNQQFAVVEDSLLPKLAKYVNYGFWEKPDDTHTVIRFATGWATKPEDVDELAKYL